MKVLVVEDDRRLADALSVFLSRAGYATQVVASGTEALQSLGVDTEAVLLDLGLPDMDGIDVCRRMRALSEVPIIIATARSEIDERVRGLRAGADDFVVKPYDARELVARLEAVTRRTCSAGIDSAEIGSLQVGDVDIDLLEHSVTVGGENVDLTPKEFAILVALARYPGVSVPRDRIIREVWGTDWNGYTHSLEVHIGSLRRKIDRESFIQTVRGIGYRLVES